MILFGFRPPTEHAGWGLECWRSVLIKVGSAARKINTSRRRYLYEWYFFSFSQHKAIVQQRNFVLAPCAGLAEARAPKSRYKDAKREACKEHNPGGGGTSQTFLLLLLPFALVISTKYVLSTHLRVRWVGTPLAAQQSGQRRISTNSGPHRPFLLVPDARGCEGVPRPAQHAARAQQACMARSPLFRQSPVFNLMMHAQGGANDPQQLSNLGLEFAVVSSRSHQILH